MLVEKALAWEHDIRDGRMQNAAALARREGVSRPLVTRMLRLASLDGRALDLVRGLPPGAPARALGLSVKGLARLADLPPATQFREVRRRLSAAGRRVS